MDKQYRYTLRKTTLGLASVAIAAFLAGQSPIASAAENGGSDQNTGFEIPEEKPVEAQQTDSAGIETDKTLLANKIIEPEEPVVELQDSPETPAVADGAEARAAAPTATAQTTAQTTTQSNEPNYTKDEENIKDFSADERYRSTQLEQGNGPNFLSDAPELDFKDGYRYKTLEPAATSPDKRKWGFEIEFDKEKGQRTYTGFSFTNSGLLGGVLDVGNVPAKSPESGGLGESFKTPNYKAETEIEITGSGRQQRNLNLFATKEDLEHINSVNNSNTIMAWEGRYTKDYTGPLRATQGDSASFSFTVNPWPNENDMLSEIKLNGSHNKKEFVQGQTIHTDITVENLDANARERLVGQVYHPVTGEIVPGAKAYIDENDKVVIEMPQGAVDENGNINKDSIFFKDSKYKGLQNLSVKFFARPRTADEFKKIVEENPENFGDGGFSYTSTGAGTRTINHKGQNVVIDKQGIDRYDYYNLIGSFNINLDDTRYYDQSFKDGNGDDTTKHTSSAVKPGVEFNVDLYVPEERKDEDLFPNQKTPEEMQEATDKNQATATIDRSFLDRENKGKAEVDHWKLEFDEKEPTKFKITPPQYAKAGDFVAVPLTYTYTNGSVDVHWFHFVVQDSTNNRPEYSVQVAFPSEEQTSPVELEEDDRKLNPVGYYIPEGTEFIDDKGNEWTVSIDGTTGEVKAQPKDPSKFDGGEKLQVPVVARYHDENEPDRVIEERTRAEFVIKERANMTPRYNAKAGKEGDVLTSEVILNEEDTYNRRPTKFSLASDTYTDDKGNVWNVTIDENTGKVTATVPNAKEGQSLDGALLNVPVIAHYYEQGSNKEVGRREVEVQFVASGTSGKVERIEEIPFETKVEENSELKKGEIKVVTEGKKGSKKVTYTIVDSKIIEEETTEEILEEATDRLIQVGTGVLDGTHTIEEKVEVPFETIVEFDDSLAPGEQEVVQEGSLGQKTRTTTLTIEDGKVVKTEEGDFEQNIAPVNRIIKVGRNTEGVVEHKEEIPFGYTVVYDPELKAGEYVVETPGRKGERATTWKIENSKVVGEPTVVETQPIDAVIKVGSKDFTGTFETKKTEAVEFETEYIVDNSLEPGTVVVEQEGELGTRETTVTHTIVNGEVTESKEGDTVQTKAPVKRIVKVGPGKTEGTHTIEEKVEVPFEVEIQFDDNLAPGEQEVVQEGVPGEKTRTTTLTIENSEITNTEVGEFTETKAPVKKIIKVGRNTEGVVEHKEEIPFGYTVEYDPDFYTNYPDATDNYKIVIEGEAGEKTTKWTIKDSKVVGDPEVTVTKQPVNAVIKVGKKDLTGTFETKIIKVVEFETEYIEDETLEPGKVVVEQEGELGEEKITVTHTIENGEVINSVEGDPVRTKEPVKRIVRVGKKPIEGETTETVEREIPYETEVIYDETLDAGTQVVEKEGKLGKEKVTITTKIVDGELETTETTELIEEKENRVVRIGVKPVVKETNLPHDTEYRFNKDLKDGEINVIEEGTEGKVEYIISFDKETGKIVVTENRTEPKNKIVEYGSKTEGKVTVESDIPYEVEIIEDPEMEAGKTEVVQEGELGKKETTITIENSQEVSREENTIKEPVKKIIKVGTKCDCEVPPVDPEDPEDPTDPTDPEDPENPTDPEDPENPTDPEDPEDPSDPEDPTDPEDPEDPTDPEDPEDPTDPEDPEDPTDPEDPKDPENPGEDDDSDEPGTPGDDDDDSDEPGTPGVDKPNEPGTPGEKDPEDPSKPGADQSGSNNSTDKPNTPSTDSATQVDKAGALPETGEEMAAHIFGAAALSILSGLGLVATKGRKEEE